jgi:hypothetical protein
MNILILSPLFPPDTGAPAPYVKTLASKLTDQKTSILIYGYLPETVPNVEIISIDKRSLLLLRLFKYTKALFQQAKIADLVIVNNGPSVELPFFFVSMIKKISFVYLESDALASKNKKFIYRLTSSLLKKRSVLNLNLTDTTLYLPDEVLPFKETDVDKQQKQKIWWTNHLENLKKI